MFETIFQWVLAKQLKLLFFSLLVILLRCAGLFHYENAAVHVISQKTQFWVTVPRAFTLTLVECSKLSQTAEAISKQSRSDRLWSRVIFGDTWHRDPLTSTQQNQQPANDGEHRAKTLSKEAHSETMIRRRLDIWEPNYSGNELENVANEYINKRAFRCPFGL